MVFMLLHLAFTNDLLGGEYPIDSRYISKSFCENDVYDSYIDHGRISAHLTTEPLHITISRLKQ